MKTTKMFLFYFLFFINCSWLNAQEDNSFKYWVKYYPFEEGIQMVEVCFGFNLNFDSTGPHYNFATGKLNPSIYIFRNLNGKIINSYNLCGALIEEFNLLHPNEITGEMLEKHKVSRYIIMSNCKCEQKNTYKYANANLSKARYGAIDKKGSTIIAPVYEKLSVVSNKNILLAKNNNNYGILDETGKVIQPFEYDDIEYWDYYGGMGIAKKNNNFLHINNNGEIISKKAYDYVGKFCTWRALVKSAGKFGYIDTTGTEIIPLVYEVAESFYGNIAIVKLNNKYGLINIIGSIIQPLEFDKIEPIPGWLGIEVMGYKGLKNGEIFLFDAEGHVNYNITNSDEFNNFISLSPIKLGTFTLCTPPKLIKQICVKNSTDTLAVIYRNCEGSTNEHGGTFDIDEYKKAGKYEIWSVNKKQLLFEATNMFLHSYNRFSTYHPREKGEDMWDYDFNIDSNGQITISNLSGKYADHEEGIYIFKNGEYHKQ